MAAKLCRANIGSRTEPIECGRPIAPGMLAACAEHKLALVPTITASVCARGGGALAVARFYGSELLRRDGQRCSGTEEHDGPMI